jgi:hypothetical protein
LCEKIVSEANITKRTLNKKIAYEMWRSRTKQMPPTISSFVMEAVK